MTVAATPGTAAPNSPRRASPRWSQTPRKLTTADSIVAIWAGPGQQALQPVEESALSPCYRSLTEPSTAASRKERRSLLTGTSARLTLIASSIRTSKLPSGKHETRDLEMILANTAKGNPLRTLIAEAALSMGGAHAR
ncbi:uncharacterized protein L3040_007215 [Drepanopeziza brunnea f. sp. 'multigermtubi']|uniref:uncharacterized protein n=1 Tax=Drepanopeziza brunnea f. sp. 'multigermtubi' TaxID=698441 RepID=UPI00239FBC5F|nr:hypothetical protein L3040_007215 [Drepanopeziza brunnea f. sp. 'multigermtubi']